MLLTRDLPCSTDSNQAAIGAVPRQKMIGVESRRVRAQRHLPRCRRAWSLVKGTCPGDARLEDMTFLPPPVFALPGCRCQTVTRAGINSAGRPTMFKYCLLVVVVVVCVCVCVCARLCLCCGRVGTAAIDAAWSADKL